MTTSRRITLNDEETRLLVTALAALHADWEMAVPRPSSAAIKSLVTKLAAGWPPGEADRIADKVATTKMRRGDGMELLTDAELRLLYPQEARMASRPGRGALLLAIRRWQDHQAKHERDSRVGSELAGISEDTLSLLSRPR